MTDSTYATSVERLEAASAAWLRDLKAHGASPNTLKGYSLTTEDFICFFADEEDAGAPSYAEIFLWRQTFDRRGLTPRTQQQYLIRLRAFFNWAVEHGWYATNPVLDRLIPSVSDLPPAEYVAFHDWQLQRLYTFNRPQNAKAATYPRNYAIAILLLTTDLRNGELLHLTPADLHWADNVITTWDGHTGEVRRVAFSDLAQSAVQLYLASGLRPKDLPDTAPLFGNTAPKGSFGPRTGDKSHEWQHGSRQWLSTLVEAHVRAVAFVPGVRCEELRHAAAHTESLSLSEARARQAGRNTRLLEQMKSRP